MRIATLVVIIVALIGCASTYYKQYTLTDLGIKLDRDRSVVIAIPENGVYQRIKYSNSAKETAYALRKAFKRFTKNTTVVSDCKELSCLKSMQSGRFDYYVVPEILRWEDRATAWSGIPDNIEIKISIYEEKNWRELSSVIIKGKSVASGKKPQDLLGEPINKYVESIY